MVVTADAVAKKSDPPVGELSHRGGHGISDHPHELLGHHRLRVDEKVNAQLLSVGRPLGASVFDVPDSADNGGDPVLVRQHAGDQVHLVHIGDGDEEIRVLDLDLLQHLGAGRDPDLDVSRTGEIWGIYVSPDYWRRGIGKRLAVEAERILKSRGYEDVVLWVLEDVLLQAYFDPLKLMRGKHIAGVKIEAVLLGIREDDFGGNDETIISNNFDKPVMIHHYPAEIKAFYMKRDPKDETYALAVDMLAPEGYGEIIGGSQREDDFDTLMKRINEHDLPEEAFAWYLDLRKFGSVPHSGFGLGIERTVAWICGLKHIRETIPFPRLMQRIYP